MCGIIGIHLKELIPNLPHGGTPNQMILNSLKTKIKIEN